MVDEAPSSPDDSPSLQIGREVDSFLENINGLARTLPLLMTVMGRVLKATHDELSTFLRANGTPVDTEEGKKGAYRLTAEHHARAHYLEQQHTEVHVGRGILPRSFLVALVSQYDYFLGRLVRCLYNIRPELLSDSERQLSFAELVAIGSVEGAREYLLEKEVEVLLRKSHADQFTWFENKFKIPLRKGLDVWPTFVELTERRNLLVHSDGIVSRQYLAICKEHGVLLDATVLLGSRLGIAPKYFRSAYRCIGEIGVKLAHVLWRKVLPDSIRDADDHLIRTVYEFLVAERYRQAAVLSDFACETLKRVTDERTKMVFIVNRAIAYKGLKNDTKCKEILASHDWSGAREEFRLALSVLEDRFSDAAAIMRAIGRDGAVSEFQYSEWPLFRRFRETEDFANAFADVFGRQYVKITKDPKVAEPQTGNESEPPGRGLADSKGEV